MTLIASALGQGHDCERLLVSPWQWERGAGSWEAFLKLLLLKNNIVPRRATPSGRRLRGLYPAAFCVVLCLACLVCLPRVFFHSLLPPRAVDMRPLDWPFWTLGGGWGAATPMRLGPLFYCTVDLKCAQLFRTGPRMTPCDTHQ